MLDLADVRGHNGADPRAGGRRGGWHNLSCSARPARARRCSRAGRRSCRRSPRRRRLEVVPHPVGRRPRTTAGLVAARPFRARTTRSRPRGSSAAAAPRRARPRWPTTACSSSTSCSSSRARARSAAPAARGRPRDDRPRPDGDGLPDALRARGGLEPVPMRPLGDDGLHLHRQPTSPAPPPASPARCWTASTCCCGRPPGRGRARTSRRRPQPRCASAVVRARGDRPRARADPPCLQRPDDVPRCYASAVGSRPARCGCSTSPRPALASRPAATAASFGSPALADLDESTSIGPDHINLAAGLRLEVAAPGGRLTGAAPLGPPAANPPAAASRHPRGVRRLLAGAGSDRRALGRFDVEWRQRPRGAVLALADEELLAVGRRRYAGGSAFDAAAPRAGWRRFGSRWCAAAAGVSAAVARCPTRRGAARARRPRGRSTADGVAIVGARRASLTGSRSRGRSGAGFRPACVRRWASRRSGPRRVGGGGGRALGRMRGRPVAVLAAAPTWLPLAQRALHAAVAERGAVVSELPPGASALVLRGAQPDHRRAGPGGGIVEAAERSGSLRRPTSPPTSAAPWRPCPAP